MHPFLALCILVVISPICKGQRADPCNVVPKDQYIEVGSSTEVVCQTTCMRGKIFWTLNNRPVDESLSTTINSSHTVLTLRNFTHHSATLQCHSAETQQILGGTTIRTYSKPSNLSCMLDNENQHQNGVPQLLTCKWEHQIMSPLKINYAVLYSLSQTEICYSNTTTCTTKYPGYLFMKFVVAVRAKTAAWEARSDPYEFEPYSILKMIPPTFTVTAKPDHLLVELRPAVSSKKCHCQVKYSKVVSDGSPEMVLSKTLDPGQNRNETIENVESCTEYKFLVRCAIDKAPWSNWTQEKKVLTEFNKRLVKLGLWRTIAEPEESEIRKVKAMWMRIPSTCQDTFTYTMKKTAYNNDTTGDNYTDILCGNSTCDVDVNQDAHRINLRAYKNGSLLAEDSVYVPATGESLPRVTDIQASTLEGVILVSWKAPVQPVSGYMIDWTDNGVQYYWKESKYTNITLSDLLDKKPYNITVTPLFEDRTGHGTQALHICSRIGDPFNVTIISVDPNDKSAFVSWNTKSQEECSGAVITYTVFYGTQKEPMLNVTVDGTRQGVSLKDLNPDTQYSVYVKATALTGTTESSERLFKTKRFDPRLLLALSVCGSIIIVLVLSLGLFCAIQWKKFSEKPVPNPSLSSVALWSSPSHQKEKCSFQPFNNPSESLCDQICTEESQRTSTSPIATSCDSSATSGQTEEYTDPVIVLAPVVQNEKSVELHLCSPEESTALLSSDNRPFNPYRSQNSVETPASTANKMCKHVPGKQLEKTVPGTIYITLDMFEQDQRR